MHQRLRRYPKQDRSEHEGRSHAKTPFVFSFAQEIRRFRLYIWRLSVDTTVYLLVVLR
jgi:hypothetical protein